MPESALFLTLRIFSATGGIEKVSRVVGKALHEMDVTGKAGLKVFSMYDDQLDVNERYFPAAVFTGFSKRKSQFVFAATRQGVKHKVVILSHINLLLAGYLIKLFSPKTRLVLLAHGIEIWSPFPSWKKHMLGKCDQVLAVSSYTKDRVMQSHGFPASKITVLNNCLDPYLPVPLTEQKNAAMLNRYGFTDANTILITLTRFSFKEQYKGYDNVLYALPGLKKNFPGLKYLLVGKYDEIEKRRVDGIILDQGLQDTIIFTGFIPDEELAAHYNIADLYIMPSKKEGFGIVFIEAMYYGKPVIAGNKDGSVDALCNGKFGLLVNPDSRQDITAAIKKVLHNKASFIPDREAVLSKFSYEVYKSNLEKIINC